MICQRNALSERRYRIFFMRSDTVSVVKINKATNSGAPRLRVNEVIMPPTLKKLMGHIAFGACVGAWVTLFVPTVTFKPLKLES